MCEYSGGKPAMRNESERYESSQGVAISTDHDPLVKGLS
jgi:hypothetical protein